MYRALPAGLVGLALLIALGSQNSSAQTEAKCASADPLECRYLAVCVKLANIQRDAENCGCGWAFLKDGIPSEQIPLLIELAEARQKNAKAEADQIRSKLLNHDAAFFDKLDSLRQSVTTKCGRLPPMTGAN